MSEILSRSDYPQGKIPRENPLKLLVEKFNSLDSFFKIQVLAIVLFLLVIPATAGLIFDTRQRAEGQTLARVEINPGEILTRVDSGNVELSALAYDISSNPIWSGVLYEWGMSSTNSVATLTSDTGDITQLDPLSVGYGDLHVIARLGDQFVTKNIQVRITNPDGSIPPTPTPTATPSPTPTPTPSPTPPPDELTVSLTQPLNNATVPAGKTIALKANAFSTTAITKVEFYSNGVRRCSDSSIPYSCNLKISSTYGISYALFAKVYDSLAKTDQSPIIQVTSGKDIVFPSVSLTNPANGSTFPGGTVVNMSANASDDVGVSKVEFYVNGSRKCSDNSSPYACNNKLTVSSPPGIIYNLSAKAYDYQGNTSQSSITVTSN